MKILIFSDAWHPQINGVVRSYEHTQRELAVKGHDVRIVGPETSRWCSFPAPSYPSICLEFFAGRRLSHVIDVFQPDAIHIATEGPLGWAARRVCLRRGKPFTTAYHTRFPEYLAARVSAPFAGLVEKMSSFTLRRFHAPAAAVMVATPSMARELAQRKFLRLVHWSRGVDTTLFQPYGKNLEAYSSLPRPVLLYVGRVAVEKNLRAFLSLQTTGSLVVIGEGPDHALLKKEYPSAHFLGGMAGEKLARHYAAADLFVFPSMTDTFGLVLLEACAAGLRIAAYPASGPVDLFADEAARSFASLNKDLQHAVDEAFRLPDDAASPRRFAENYAWESCTAQFFQHLQAPLPEVMSPIALCCLWLAKLRQAWHSKRP